MKKSGSAIKFSTNLYFEVFFSSLAVLSKIGCQLEFQDENVLFRFDSQHYFRWAAKWITNFKTHDNSMVRNQVVFTFAIDVFFICSRSRSHRTENGYQFKIHVGRFWFAELASVTVASENKLTFWSMGGGDWGRDWVDKGTIFSFKGSLTPYFLFLILQSFHSSSYPTYLPSASFPSSFSPHLLASPPGYPLFLLGSVVFARTVTVKVTVMVEQINHNRNNHNNGLLWLKLVLSPSSVFSHLNVAKHNSSSVIAVI